MGRHAAINESGKAASSRKGQNAPSAVDRPLATADTQGFDAPATVVSERRAARAASQAHSATTLSTARKAPVASVPRTKKAAVAASMPSTRAVVVAPRVTSSHASSGAFSRPAPKKRIVLPLVGFAATFAFLSASLVNPLSGAQAATASPVDAVPATAAAAGYAADGQSYTVSADAASTTSRDAYTVDYTAPVIPKPKPVVTATTTAKSASTSSGSSSESSSSSVASTPRPVVPSGTAQEIGAQLVAARGWDGGQFSCLVSLWNRESGWNVYASNGSSGAYGIPQALPGSKMASAGSDWQTSAATQITWGLNYIQGRYSTPCGAWAHSESNGWY